MMFRLATWAIKNPPIPKARPATVAGAQLMPNVRASAQADSAASVKCINMNSDSSSDGESGLRNSKPSGYSALTWASASSGIPMCW